MKRILQLLLILLITRSTCFSQDYSSQRTQVLLVNVLSNGIIGGIGGAIHKKPGEKTVHAFLINFCKGSAGGLVKYNAKAQTIYLPFQPLSVMAPINRLYYFLGHSMVMNSAYNRKMLERYTCNFYGIDLQVDFKAEQKIKARLSIATAASAAYFAARGFQFDLFRSLEFGQLIFVMRPGQLGIFAGEALFNSIVIEGSLARPNLGYLPHEIVHTYQAYDWFGISSFYDKKLSAKIKDKKLFTNFSNYFVMDYEALFLTALYLPQYRPLPNYFKNYFEFEAEHFATRQYVKR